MPLLIPLNGKTPRVAPSAFIAPDATLIGDVEIGDEASVWFGCVLRADIGFIRVGPRSNVQDLSCVHMTDGLSNTVIGADVTVGHGCILHGCTVGDGCLVGMGSVLLDLVELGAESVVGAKSLVTQRMKVPARSLLLGAPAKIVRAVRDDEARLGVEGARHYVETLKHYRG